MSDSQDDLSIWLLTSDFMSGILLWNQQTTDGTFFLFDGAQFLTETVGGTQDILALFAAYGVQAPAQSAVEKWFQRGNTPGKWLAVMLGLLELERGRPVSVCKFLNLDRKVNAAERIGPA